MILIIVAGCVLFVIVMTIIICKCCRKKQHTTIAEKEAMFNQQNVTHEHDAEYGIQKPDPKNKSNNSFNSNLTRDETQLNEQIKVFSLRQNELEEKINNMKTQVNGMK